MNHASVALKLSYNPKWLCILKSTNHLHLEGNSERLKFEQRYVPTAEEEKVIQEIFKTGFDIPKNFSQTVTVFDPEEDEKLSVVGQQRQQTTITKSTNRRILWKIKYHGSRRDSSSK